MRRTSGWSRPSLTSPSAKAPARAQIALAWLLVQRPWIGPIPGTTKLHRLEENVGAATLELLPDDLAAIHTVLAELPVEGTRYLEAGMKLIDR